MEPVMSRRISQRIKSASTINYVKEIKKPGKELSVPQFPFEEDWEQSQEIWHLACHEVHIEDTLKLTGLVQFRHHLKCDLPSTSPSASKHFFPVSDQVPARKELQHMNAFRLYIVI